MEQKPVFLLEYYWGGEWLDRSETIRISPNAIELKTESLEGQFRKPKIESKKIFLSEKEFQKIQAFFLKTGIQKLGQKQIQKLHCKEWPADYPINRFQFKSGKTSFRLEWRRLQKEPAALSKTIQKIGQLKKQLF